MNLDSILNFIIHNRKLFSKWNYNRKGYNHLIKLSKDFKREELAGKTFVFDVMRILKEDLDSQVFLGFILAIHGAKVKILLDDGVLMHWDTIQLDNYYKLHLKETPKNIKKFPINPYYDFNYRNYKNLITIVLERLYRKKSLKTYSKKKNLEIIFYSQLINNKNLKFENLEELKKHCESSTVRFFRNIDLDYNDKFVELYYKLSLKNAIISRKLGEYILNKIKPDYFLTAHAIYSSQGPIFEFLKKNGVECRVLDSFNIYSKTYSDYLITETIHQTISKSKFWLDYKNTPVTEEMKKEVLDYFEERFNFPSWKREQCFFNMDKTKLQRIDKNDGYKYHIAMFPNLMWDGNVKERHVFFNGLLDWLISTINYVKNRKDIKLYIKAHPHELTRSINTPKIIELIKKHVNVNDIDNLVLLYPELKINSYEFIKSGIDLGLVYDGVLAIELPLLKVPTIMCVKGGQNYVEGGQFVPDSKEEYFNYLDNIDKIKKEFNNNYENFINNIIRWVYWMFYIIPVRIPTFQRRGRQKFDLMLLNKEDLMLDKNLMKILNLSY